MKKKMFYIKCTFSRVSLVSISLLYQSNLTPIRGLIVKNTHNTALHFQKLIVEEVLLKLLSTVSTNIGPARVSVLAKKKKEEEEC